MQFTIPHKETQVAAVTRVKKALYDHRAEILKNAPDAEERWEGNTLIFSATMQGQKISGTVAVLEHAFDIEVKLPLMLRMFEGRIKKALEEQTKGLLG